MRMPRRVFSCPAPDAGVCGCRAHPVADGACGVLDAVKALAMDALLLGRPDHAFDHAILLRAVRRDKLLLQALAANQRGVFLACEDQAIVRLQKEFLRHLSERAEPVDQRMFESTGGGNRLAGA